MQLPQMPLSVAWSGLAQLVSHCNAHTLATGLHLQHQLCNYAVMYTYVYLNLRCYPEIWPHSRCSLALAAIASESQNLAIALNTMFTTKFQSEPVHLQVLMSVALLVLLLLLLLLATMLLPLLPQLQLARARVARLLHPQMQPPAKTLLLPHLLLPVATPQLLHQLLLQLVRKLLLLHQLLLVVAITVAAVVAAQAIQVGALARQAKGYHLLKGVPSPQVEVTSSPQAWAQVPLEAHTSPQVEFTSSPQAWAQVPLEAHTSPRVEVISSPQAWAQVPLEAHTSPR